MKDGNKAPSGQRVVGKHGSTIEQAHIIGWGSENSSRKLMIPAILFFPLQHSHFSLVGSVKNWQ